MRVESHDVDNLATDLLKGSDWTVPVAEGIRWQPKGTREHGLQRRAEKTIEGVVVVLIENLVADRGEHTLGHATDATGAVVNDGIMQFVQDRTNVGFGGDTGTCIWVAELSA